MKIEWNQVTWYSKLGAVILFVGVVPTLTFYIGTKYQQTIDFVQTSEKNPASLKSENLSVEKQPVDSKDPKLVFKSFGIPEAGEISYGAFFDQDNNIVKKILPKDLGLDEWAMLEMVEWVGRDLWVIDSYTAGQGYFKYLIKIDSTDFTFEVFDLSELSLNQQTTNFNLEHSMIAYSTFPVSSDYDPRLEQELIQLYVYNIRTKEKKLIASLVGGNFQSEWVDGNTLEYNSQTEKGLERVKILIP